MKGVQNNSAHVDYHSHLLLFNLHCAISFIQAYIYSETCICNRKWPRKYIQIKIKSKESECQEIFSKKEVFIIMIFTIIRSVICSHCQWSQAIAGKCRFTGVISPLTFSIVCCSTTTYTGKLRLRFTNNPSIVKR